MAEIEAMVLRIRRLSLHQVESDLTQRIDDFSRLGPAYQLVKATPKFGAALWIIELFARQVVPCEIRAEPTKLVLQSRQAGRPLARLAVRFSKYLPC
jgi:hypothetical protein